MKKLVICIIFFIGLAQISLKAQEPLVCDTVIQAEGQTVSHIHDALQKIFVANFKDSRDVLQVNDADHLVARIYTPFVAKGYGMNGYTGVVSAIYDIRIREGRFKVNVSNFTHEAKKNPLGNKYQDKCTAGLIYVLYPENRQDKGIKKLYEQLVPFAVNWAKSWFDIFKIQSNSIDEDNW